VAKAQEPVVYFSTLVERWKKILGLTDWWIHVQVVPDPDDDPDSPITTLMHTNWATHYKSCTVSVFPAALGLPDAKKEKCIVHELLHLVFCWTDDMLEEALGGGTVFTQFREKMEGAIDGLANRLQETCRAYRT